MEHYTFSAQARKKKKIHHEKVSYTSGNGNPRKNFLYFLKRKLLLYFSKRKP